MNPSMYVCTCGCATKQIDKMRACMYMCASVYIQKYVDTHGPPHAPCFWLSSTMFNPASASPNETEPDPKSRMTGNSFGITTFECFGLGV